jgi:hypothetical protein
MSLSSRIFERRPDLPDIQYHPELGHRPKVSTTEAPPKRAEKQYTPIELNDFEDIFDWLSLH